MQALEFNEGSYFLNCVQEPTLGSQDSVDSKFRSTQKSMKIFLLRKTMLRSLILLRNHHHIFMTWS